jgi:hypothetical protein
VLAGSSNWVPVLWVFNFEKKIQNWKLEMGTSQQPEPKLGTGLQLEPDSERELTPKLIACNFRFFIFIKIKNKKFKFESCFFPLPD